MLKRDGTVFLNLGDSYAANRTYQVPDNKHVDVKNSHGSKVPVGLKPKDLIGIPWRTAFALQEQGWWLRSDIIWQKNNAFPESVTDRPTRSHEYVFLLTKSSKYYYDADAISEKATSNHSSGNGYVRPERISHATGSTSVYTPTVGGRRNSRDVWSINTESFYGNHYAVMPQRLAAKCILAGSKPGDTILDPFSGAATTAVVALQLNRKAIGIDLSQEYTDLSIKRINAVAMELAKKENKK